MSPLFGPFSYFGQNRHQRRFSFRPAGDGGSRQRAARRPVRHSRTLAKSL